MRCKDKISFILRITQYAATDCYSVWCKINTCKLGKLKSYCKHCDNDMANFWNSCTDICINCCWTLRCFIRVICVRALLSWLLNYDICWLLCPHFSIAGIWCLYCERKWIKDTTLNTIDAIRHETPFLLNLARS